MRNDDVAQSRTVLVVDDDPAIRDVLSLALEDDGYRVECAANGREALRKAEQCPPDAVVLDVMMPTMDGWEFLARWRARPVDQQAPVLVVSAASSSRAALEHGAHGYLSTPFDLDTLESTLAIVL